MTDRDLPLSPGLVDVALADVGRTDASAYRARPGHLNWCAAAVCAWLRRAGLPAPEHPDPASRGAKALGRWLGARYGYTLPYDHTRVELDRCQPQPGDVIVWHRGTGVTWRGHVALVVAVGLDDSIETVAGNERASRGVEIQPGRLITGPAVRHRRLTRAEWTRRVYCVARSA